MDTSLCYRYQPGPVTGARDRIRAHMSSIGETLVIELLKTSDYLYISELCDRGERALEESKLRYPLPKDSPAILMQVTLEASKKTSRSLSKEVS